MTAPFFKKQSLPNKEGLQKRIVSFGAEPDSILLAVTAALFDTLRQSNARHDELIRKVLAFYAEAFPDISKNFITLLTPREALYQQMQKATSLYKLLEQYAACFAKNIGAELKKVKYYPFSLLAKNERSMMHSYMVLDALAAVLNIKITLKIFQIGQDFPRKIVCNKAAPLAIELILNNGHFQAFLAILNLADFNFVRRISSQNMMAEVDAALLANDYKDIEAALVKKLKDESTRLSQVDLSKDDLVRLYIKTIDSSASNFSGLQDGHAWFFNILVMKYPHLYDHLEKELGSETNLIRELKLALAFQSAIGAIDLSSVYEDDFAISPSI
ncbi:MAG: hypothetical protein LCH30_06985 [Proteobacteria bacterium]|nr:hypothetical protein [Pseudomonadota bacterium]